MLKERRDRLRRMLDKHAAETDDALLARYTLPRPPLPRGAYWRLRWLAARALHYLERWRLVPFLPWPAALRHAPGSARTKPFLIWAMGTDRDTLRRACEGFSMQRLDDFAPVLVTDVADFAFFSRLGWLVEYLPALEGEGEPYEQRKTRYLAHLYQGAPVVPVAVGLELDAHSHDEMRRWLQQGE